MWLVGALGAGLARLVILTYELLYYPYKDLGTSCSVRVALIVKIVLE